MPRRELPFLRTLIQGASRSVIISGLIISGLAACGPAPPTPPAFEGPDWAVELVESVDSASGSGDSVFEPGSRVWALRPDANGTAELGAFRVDGGAAGPARADAAARAGEESGEKELGQAEPGEAEPPVPEGWVALVDGIGNGFRLPAALAWPAATFPSPPEPDALVGAWHVNAGLVLARLRSTEPSTVAFDWNGVTVESEVEAIHDPTGLPRWVVVGDEDGFAHLARAVAEVGSRIWTLDSAGHVSIRDASEVKPAVPWSDDPPVGASARLFDGAAGLLPVTVESVIEPGLRYRVRLDGPSDGASRAVPFDVLLRAETEE